MKIKKVVKKLNGNYIAKCNYMKYYKKLKIDEKMILLESQQGKEYYGNIYYLAKELIENEKYREYKIYMSIIGKKKKEAEDFLSIKNMNRINLVEINTKEYYKIISTAKYLINDNTFLPFFIKKDEQVYLNTWHGTPLKSLGKKIKNDFHNIGNAQKNFIISNYLLYPNEYTKNHMIEDYMIGNLCDNTILLEGYPRNTVFFDNKLQNEIRKKFSLENKQIISYMPTWRGTLGKQNSSVQSENLKYIFEEMEENLSENQILYVNLHPIEKATVDFSNYNKVKPFPSEYETYEFLSISDMLVTDYSSVFFDFLNTRKKIILYTYDKESYLEDRGLYMGLEQLPFPIVNNVEELIKEINSKKDYDETKFIENFCKYDSKDSTKKICERVILNKRGRICEEKNNGNGKKNILIFGGKLACNGITSALKNLVISLDKDKANYYIVVETGAVKRNMNQLYDLSKYVNYIPIKGKTNLTLFQKILFYMYKNKFINTDFYMKYAKEAYKADIKRVFGNAKIDDVIHFSGYAYKKILFFSQFDCNKIIFAHSNMYEEAELKGNIRLDILKYAYNQYDKVALVTEDLLEPMKKILDNPNKYAIVNNIIDYKKVLKMATLPVAFDKNTESNIDLIKLNDILNGKSKKIITIGRFSKEKGHIRLIKSFEKIWSNNNRVYLIIIGGEGNDYNNILSEVENSKCKDNIIIIKYVSNPYAILNKCDYFILSSFYEGFGLVLAEADILGKPVVAPNIVGPSKFMEKHGGTLVQNSEDGIYEGLKLLMEDRIRPMNVNYEDYNNNAIKQFEKLLK